VSAANEPFTFAEIARIPAPGDNVAIALQTLPAGSRILIRQLVFEFAHTVLEGHRFAIHRIRKGEPLLSWSLPFGLATRDIEPGEYVCNEKILQSLRERSVDLVLPATHNFIDHRLVPRIDEAAFKPSEQVKATGQAPTFQGFRRNERRGAGTRNYVVLLGTSSRSAGFVRSLASRFKNVPKDYPNIDGVVPIDHTEGGSGSQPHNFELTLRTLAGFIVNPNVGAVFCVDFPNEVLSNAALRKYLGDHRYPTEGLVHDFFSVSSSFEKALAAAEKKVARYLPVVNQYAREALPMRYLKLGLQCGGSDAFSGISANPVVGIMSRETVAYGGSANLAETDELIGAETYVLEKVRDLENAKAFLATLDRFQQWAALHGHSAEGNPSGGNRFRGLYNITIKSLGAARKKDPATRLDYVIDFGEPMPEPGFYFMNSPGNDLESIAGQVASGCNMILFATGNGSITNFPFVPTIKLMTTTRRFELVRNEMDFNAGRYLDGEPLEGLGKEAFEQMLRIASGERSAGERAGHSQVQLWREWRGGASANCRSRGDETLISSPDDRSESRHLDSYKEDELPPALLSAKAPEQVALVLPTSLCSGQVAALIAEKLNLVPDKSFSRAIALPHTEGCGNSAGESEQLFLRTMAGYLTHPLVAKAVLLEHGCEKTHNDAFLHVLRDLKIDPSRFGFASIQLDGGLERVTRKVLKQFAGLSPQSTETGFTLGFAAARPNGLEREIASQTVQILSDHGLGVIVTEALGRSGQRLTYGERCAKDGNFWMETPTDDLPEIITGLAATGAQVVLVFASEWLVPGNPLVPTLQIADRDRLPAALRDDVDILYSATEGGVEAIARSLIQALAEIRAGSRKARSVELGNTSFQITRGYTGISL
jgi:altronate dehydratase